MKMQFNFPVPFINAQPLAIVPAGLSSGIDISAPYFRGIRSHRNYNLFDEFIRQSNRLNESEKIKWISRWLHSDDPNQH